MPHGLPVGTDGPDFAAVHAGLAQQVQAGLGKALPQPPVQRPQALDLVRARVADCVDGLAQCRCQGVLVTVEQFHAVAAQPHQRRVHSVHAGARHETNEKGVCHGGLLRGGVERQLLTA